MHFRQNKSDPDHRYNSDPFPHVEEGQIAEARIILRTALRTGSNALRPHEEEVQITAQSYRNGGISDEGIQEPHGHTVFG